MPQSKKMKRELCQHQNMCEPETREEKTSDCASQVRGQSKPTPIPERAARRGKEMSDSSEQKAKANELNAPGRASKSLALLWPRGRALQRHPTPPEPDPAQRGARDNQWNLQMGSGMCQGLGHGSEVVPDQTALPFPQPQFGC